MFFLQSTPNLRNGCALALFALFPGAVYQHAVFPLSMLLLFATVQGALLCRRRFAWAGVFGALGAATYSTGFLLSAVGAVCAAIFAGRDRTARITAAATTFGISSAGLVAVLVLHQIKLGAWDAFFKTQAKYGHGIHNPLYTWLCAVGPIGDSSSGAARAIAAQTVFVAASLTLGFSTFARMRGRRAWTHEEIWAVVYAIAFWMFPLVMGTGVSLYRAEALLAPAALLLRDHPRAFTVTWVMIAAWLCYLMGSLFFAEVLI